MSFHASKEYLDELRSRLGRGLVGIIEETVSLTRRGSLLEACCPFHDEKTPSFTVQDGKAGWHYHCFSGSCGAKGDVFAWLRTQRGMTFHQAVEYVARLVGMELPEVSPEARQKRDRLERLSDVVAQAARWFSQCLEQDCGRDALDYLEGRGITADQRAEFQIGYAPRDYAAWREFAERVRRRGYTNDDLVDSGLFSRDERGLRPFFFNKLMITIRTPGGRAVAFAGRRMGDGDGPKYINSRDSELFSKRRIVYNADRAAVHVAVTRKPVVMVEGYFDVFEVERAGYPAVCCMGTAATPEQMTVVWKINAEASGDPVLCFDGDKPGLAASEKAAQTFLPLIGPDQSLRLALLEGSHDPAELLRTPHGPRLFRSALERARTAPMVLYRAALAGLPREPTPEQVAAFENRVEFDIIRGMTDRSLQMAYREEFRRLRRQRTNPRFQPKPDQPPPPASHKDAALIACMVRHPALFPEFVEELGELEMPTPELEHCMALVIAWLSIGETDEERNANAARLVDECYEITDMILTAAVETAAPFVRADAEPDQVRAGVRAILLDKQVETVRREIKRWMGMLNGSDQDAEIRVRVSALLRQLRS